jgi:hypothetical protein
MHAPAQVFLDIALLTRESNTRAPAAPLHFPRVNALRHVTSQAEDALENGSQNCNRSKTAAFLDLAGQSRL